LPHLAETDEAATRWRWVAIGVFVLSASLNYLDRQLLAAAAPSVMSEFRLNNVSYGLLLSAFSLTYLFVVPFAGLLIDRVGLHASTMIAVGAWSLVSAGTGLTSTFRGLLTCRMGLGIAEAAGIPSSSKATAMYLKPKELGLGIAVQAIGVSIGMISAPLVVAAVVPRFGWRAAFVVCGMVGLAWVPLWRFTSRRIPARANDSSAPAMAVRELMRDRRLWGILAANTLIMTVHSMWMNWTTVYLVQVHRLTPTEANRYFAWIPPIFATLGGLVGASLVLRSAGRGQTPFAARLRMCTLVAPFLLVTAVVPLMGSPALAAAAISASFFACMMMLSNLHAIPIDLFGVGRSAYTAGLLACSYALMQMVLSPAMGAIADAYGFRVLCVIVSVLPLIASFILRVTLAGDASRRIPPERQPATSGDFAPLPTASFGHAGQRLSSQRSDATSHTS